MFGDEGYDPGSVDIYSLGMILHSLLCYPPNGFLLPLKQVSPKCNALLFSLLDQEPKNRPTINQIFESEWFMFMRSLSLSSSFSSPTPSSPLSNSSSWVVPFSSSSSSSSVVEASEPLEGGETPKVAQIQPLGDDVSSTKAQTQSNTPLLFVAEGRSNVTTLEVITAEELCDPSEEDEEQERLCNEAMERQRRQRQEEESNPLRKIERQKRALKGFNWDFVAHTNAEILNIQHLLFRYCLDRLRQQGKHRESCALLKNILFVIRKQEKLVIKSTSLAASHSYDIERWSLGFKEALGKFESLHKILLAEIIIEQNYIEESPHNTGIHCSPLDVIDRAIHFYNTMAEDAQTEEQKQKQQR